MRLLQFQSRMRTAGIRLGAVGEAFWQSRSHPEEAFLLWLPLIKASFWLFLKKPLFKPTICGGSSQPAWRQDGSQGHSQKVTGRVTGFLHCNCISFQGSPYPDQDPTDAETLTQQGPTKIIHHELVMSIGETVGTGN